MKTIELKYGFFIQVDKDARCYDLKQRYDARTTDGEYREGIRVISYHSSDISALERFVKINRTIGIEDENVSLSQYVEAIKKADKEIKDALSGLEVHIEDS